MKKSIIYDDLYRYCGTRSLKHLLRYLFFTPGFRYIFIYRQCQKRNLLFPLFFVLLRHYQIKYCIQIPYQTQIGKGFRIAHFGNIVIHPETKIGTNFNIANGCTIGNSGGKKKGTPVIGDCVSLQANCVVVGGIKIGNNVLIAPNTFVNFDVPNNSIVIGQKATIIYREDASNWQTVYKI